MEEEALNPQDTSNSPDSSGPSKPKSNSFYKTRLKSLTLRMYHLPRVTRLVFTFLLLYVLIGTYIDSDWWYTFLFEGGVFSSEHWETGWDYLVRTFFWTVMIVAPVLFLFWWLVPPPKKQRLRRIWAKANLSGTRGFYLRFALLVILLLRLASVNTTISRERAEASIRVEQLVAERQSDPLSRPTSFIFLSKDIVDSLYGQYEPELVPATVIEEIQNSTDAKAGVNIQDFLKTEVGKNELQRKLTEYRQSPKNSERKLGDLLRFLLRTNLASSGYIKRYGNVETKSDEMRQLDRMTQLLKSTYNLSVEQQELTVVRDRLLSEEIQRIVAELKELHGLTLVEGDWSIVVQPDAYILKRPFIDNVTGSPFCETKVPKVDVSPQNREIIEGLKGERMRLSVFGNVITGMHNQSKTVRVNPIAVF